MRSQYEASQKELQKQLTAMENAALRGTEEWYDAVEALNEVNSAITECDTSIAEMNNSITDIANTIHEKLLNSLSSVSDEMEWITGLMSEMDMFNEDDGAFTKEGLATLGSYVSGLNMSKYSATISKGLVEEMQKALDSNKLEFTFNKQSYKFNSKEQLEDAIKEANETWRDQITDTYEYSNKIIDMMVEKLESELSALKELIEAKKDALDAEKELHDYQISIKESTDNVASLQKQIAALQGDTSEEGTMRIQKLQKELSDAQNDLKEKEYDQYISDQQDMLDKLMEEYESLITAETQNRDALLQKGIDAVKLSAGSIKDTIEKYADKYDYTDVLDNIQSGLKTMTGNDSALNQIKTSVLSSIEPIGTLPSAIVGLNLSVVSGLGNISSQLNQFLKEKIGTTSNTTTHSAVPAISAPVQTLINRVHGFSKGGVVPVDDIEKQVEANGDKVLISANPGEGLLTPVQTEMFEKFVGKLPELNQMPDIMPPTLVSMPKMPERQSIADMVPNNIEATYNFTLENCTNADDIIREIQQSNKVQKALREVTVNRSLGSNRLGVNKIK